MLPFSSNLNHFSRLISLCFPRVLPQILSASWLGISVSSAHDLKRAVKRHEKVERRWVKSVHCRTCEKCVKAELQRPSCSRSYLLRNLGMALSHHTAFLDLTHQLFTPYSWVKHSQGNKKPLMVPLVSGFLINSKMKWSSLGFVNVC